ncbi:MAG: hypothetical protein RLZZ433_8 [Pseudomonadota bacterium]
MKFQNLGTSQSYYQLDLLRVLLILSLLVIPKLLFAQSIQAETDQLETINSQFSYTLGLRIKSTDSDNGQHITRLRPIIGLRYGKWQIGIGDGRSWRNVGQFGTEPTLSYQLFEEPELSIGMSMRVHNVSTGETFDVFEGGKNTLRSRVMVQRKLNRQWRLHLDWTQDLLNKGDSTTINLGMSYAWPVFKQSELILSANTTWATAEHWRNTSIVLNTPSTHSIPTGFQKMGAGVTFKQNISKQWAWYSSLAIAHPIQNLKQVQGSKEWVNAQVGVLYFQR